MNWFQEFAPLIISTVASSIASFYGAFVAMKEILARFDERLKSHSERLEAAENRIDSAHSRIDSMLNSRSAK